MMYRFTGKERDEETGLYYYGARYQDPKTSRWLSTDPALADYIPGAPVNDEAKKRNSELPGMGGVFNTVNLHLYHYAGNNPVKYTDPTGMWTEKMAKAVGAVDMKKEYVSGSWDCDIFVESIIKAEDSGASLPSGWGAASETNVAKHLTNMKDNLKDAPAKGTNIVLQGGNHMMLMGVNDDGSVDVIHISSGNEGKLPVNRPYESVEKFKEYWSKIGNGELKFLPLNDAPPTPTPPPQANPAQDIPKTEDHGAGK